ADDRFIAPITWVFRPTLSQHGAFKLSTPPEDLGNRSAAVLESGVAQGRHESYIMVGPRVSISLISAVSTSGQFLTSARVSFRKIFLSGESTFSTAAEGTRTDLPPSQLLVSTTK